MTDGLLRGRDFCRACESADLFSALDLGSLPIANELLFDIKIVETYPLHLKICGICGLGQVGDVVTPHRLFSDYRYLSSISSTFLKHAANYVNEVINSLTWKKGDWVLEIASNDGYLLKNFLKHDISVLGIEPATNIAELAVSQNIPTINEFFGSEIAQEILNRYGYPRLIIANNVFAHVPDIRDFTLGLSILMNEETLVSIENPSIINFLVDLQFDSIYHEHYSYHSVNSLSNLVQAFGIFLINVEKISTHGGSNRYWLSKNNSEIHASVLEIAKWEIDQGLFNPNAWQEFAKSVNRIISDFQMKISELRGHGKIIAGYGAAAKASTLINAARLKEGDIAYIVDESPEKIGRFMPLPNIPIVDKNMLNDSDLANIFIFPWNLSEEIALKIRNQIGNVIEIWAAIPTLRRIP